MLENQNLIRLSVFFGVLLAMALLEAWRPRKIRVLSRKQRWVTNLGLIVIDSLALRFLLPVVAIGVAVKVNNLEFGLLNLVDLPKWLEAVIAIVLLDMLIYWQHVASHHFSWLWALHKVHHADRDIDVTTGVRFHPIEIVLSMLYKMLIIVLLGPAVVAVFIFEVLLNACALFNHANLKLSPQLDRLLRPLLVTPDMHRVHHSVRPEETNSNYGFSLSWWDRLFGSYIAQPTAGHQAMTIGLAEHQNQQPASLLWTLSLPFHKSRSHGNKVD